MGKCYILGKRISYHACGKNGKDQVWTWGQIYDKSWTAFDIGSNICHAQWHVQGETSAISKFIQTHINLGDFEGFISWYIIQIHINLGDFEGFIHDTSFKVT